MYRSKRPPRLLSVCAHQWFLLLTIQLFCHAVNCNSTISNEFTATHPETHPTERITTSTSHIDGWRNSTAAGIDFTDDNNNVLNSNSSDFPKTNETSAINSLDTAKTVNIANSGQGNDVMVGQQVLGHVTQLAYISPTSDSPGHVTNTTIPYPTQTGRRLTNPRLSAAYDDIIITSSHGVPGNQVTENMQTTSLLLQQEPTVTVSGSKSAWEIPITDVEPETLQYTSRNGNGSSDQLVTSSATSSNHTSRHPTRNLIDKGKPCYQSCSLFTEYRFVT